MNKKLTDQEIFKIKILNMITESNKNIEETNEIIARTSKKIKKLMEGMHHKPQPIKRKVEISLHVILEAARFTNNNQN